MAAASEKTRYHVKWDVAGFNGTGLKAGSTYEAKLDDVKAFVSVRWGGEAKNEEHAALIPADQVEKMLTEGRYCSSCGAFDTLVKREA